LGVPRADVWYVGGETLGGPPLVFPFAVPPSSRYARAYFTPVADLHNLAKLSMTNLPITPRIDCLIHDSLLAATLLAAFGETGVM
jgi:hypothetical protein